MGNTVTTNTDNTPSIVKDSAPPIRPPTPEETADLAQTPLPNDFISTYAQYADVLEAPKSMHEAVGIQLLATVLNMNDVSIPLGSLSSPLDLWVVLLSGSGLGRSTLVGLARPILKEAELEGIEQASLWGSPQALYQQLAGSPNGLFIWGELSERLKLLNEPRFGSAKQWITDRYDNSKTPDPITYRETGKQGRDTPPIRFPRVPRINILATSSEEWFFNSLLQEDSAGGFVPRWVIMRPTDSGRDVPVPKELDPDLVEPLADHLKKASELTGKADLSGILGEYKKWYLETKCRFQSQPNPSLAMAYFNRHRAHILKLAVIYEVSSSLSLCVSKSSWARAVQAAKELENTIFVLLPTGMSGSGYALNQMVERVRETGADGLSLSTFTRAFQHQNAKERKDRLTTLVEGETVHVYNRSTTGRSAKILVHSDFLQEYRAGHPKESRYSGRL